MYFSNINFILLLLLFWNGPVKVLLSKTPLYKAIMSTRYIVGCGAVVRNKDGRFLMVKQLGGYWGGKWIFPGGKLEPGETLEDCVRREVLEETHIIPALKSQIKAYVSYDPDTKFEKQVVLIYYSGDYTGGEIKAGDGVTDVAWFHMSEIENMAAEGIVPYVIYQVAIDSLNNLD
jgi:mutator protein MutT